MRKSNGKSNRTPKRLAVAVVTAMFATILGRAAPAAILLPTDDSPGSGSLSGGGAEVPYNVNNSVDVQIYNHLSSEESTSQVFDNVPGDPSQGTYTYDLKFEVNTTIYRNTNSNTLDFVYQIYNLSDDNGIDTYGDTILSLTLQSFAGYSVLADYEYNTGAGPVTTDVAPVSADRTGTNGAIVGFGFSDLSTVSTLIPDATSDYLVVSTNATAYTDGTASVLGGLGVSGQIQVPFGVAQSVPEPTSMLLAGLSGCALLSRRRRAAR